MSRKPAHGHAPRGQVLLGLGYGVPAEVEDAGSEDGVGFALGDGLVQVVQVARGHFAKEEQVLYPMAQQALGDAKLAELGARWAERRQVVVVG